MAFTKLFNWFADAIRNPKIQDSRFDAEFSNFYAGINAGAYSLNITQTGSGSLGSTSPTDFGYPYNHLQITSDGYDVSGYAAGKQFASAFLIEDYPNNSGKGNRNAITAAVWVPPGSTVDTTGDWGYCGGLFFGKTDINLGGTGLGALTAKGSVFGSNPYATAGSSATNLFGVVASEGNVLTNSGSSMRIRVGFSSVDLGSAVQASNYDSAFTVGALAGSVGWKNGLTFVDMNGGAPLSTSGKLITTIGSATVDSGIDISGYTITTAAFKSNGFTVDGSGNINGKTTLLTSTASHALAIGRQGTTDPAFAVDASAASQATGIAVVGAASGSGAGFSVISPGTNELLAINSKGSSDTYINNSSTGSVRIGNALLPKTDDAAALGSTTDRWADLHLSTGAVINYNNGNLTLTHSSGLLSCSGNLIASGLGTGPSTVFTTAPDESNDTSKAGTRILNAGFIGAGRDSNPAAQFNRMTSDGTLIGMMRAGSQVGSVSVTTTNTAFNTSSDKDRKFDQRDFDRARAIIEQLKIWDFAWRACPDRRGVGVFAQDAYHVFPDAIMPSDKKGGWEADYSKFVPVLIAGLQEAFHEIDILKQKLAE